MASVSVPAGEPTTVAEGLCYSVQVKNTGDSPVTVGGVDLGQDGQVTIYPIAWQPVVATSEKGGEIEVTVTSLGASEPVTTAAVSHDEPAAGSQEPVTEPASESQLEPESGLAPQASEEKPV
jgi:hypothetical protein